MPRRTPTTPDPLDAIIGQTVRARRIGLGLSQRDLADAIGVTFRQVQKYEKGANRMAVSRLIRVARALDCKITDFIPEEDR